MEIHIIPVWETEHCQAEASKIYNYYCKIIVGINKNSRAQCAKTPMNSINLKQQVIKSIL